MYLNISLFVVRHNDLPSRTNCNAAWAVKLPLTFAKTTNFGHNDIRGVIVPVEDVNARTPKVRNRYPLVCGEGTKTSDTHALQHPSRHSVNSATAKNFLTGGGF